MIDPNQRGVLSRLLLTLLLLIPNAACECDAESGILPPGISLGSSLAGVLILDPGSDYEVGDEVLFGSTQLLAAGTGAAAFISEVDGAGGVTAVEITHVGQGYEVAPTLSIQTEAGDNCVLLADLRIVEICLANVTGTHINGALLLTVPGLFGEASLEFPISAVCFSELGSDECFLSANGTLSLGALEELEVTLFTTTLNEFIEMGDHPIRSREEGMLLVHKIDLDGDGEYEIADGEIIFHTALGAIGLSNATIDAETDAFAADYSGVFDGSFGVSGAIEFYDCD
jgi:hypothetical protein